MAKIFHINRDILTSKSMDCKLQILKGNKKQEKPLGIYLPPQFAFRVLVVAQGEAEVNGRKLSRKILNSRHSTASA